jgi:hypothetical protein
MKKLITPIIALALIMSSCTATTENIATDIEKAATEAVESAETETIGEAETENEDLINAEGSAVEGDERYANMSQESTTSDCYIVSDFIDMDIHYITVDFVNYKVVENEGDSEPGYELVNEKKKLRTFLVDEGYLDCAHDKTVSIKDLMEASKDKENVFMITTEEGSVTELFVRRCAG